MNDMMPARHRAHPVASPVRAVFAPSLCSMKSRGAVLPAWLALSVCCALAVTAPALAIGPGEGFGTGGGAGGGAVGTAVGGAGGGAGGAGGGAIGTAVGGAGGGAGGGGDFTPPPGGGGNTTSSVPEMDPGAAGAALALLISGGLILVDRLRPRLRSCA